MPELPEVEGMGRNLRRWTEGARVLELAWLDPRLGDPGPPIPAGGLPIQRVWRRAKYLILSLPDRSWILHFRMTGKVVPGPRPLARARLHLDRGGPVDLVDPRRFATWRSCAPGEEEAALPPLGPEPWPDRRDGAWWAACFAGARGPLKPTLMRQDRVAGIGNILASEICWRAALSPALPTDRLTAADWQRVAAEAHALIEEVLAHETGEEIRFLHEGGDGPFAVYGRQGEPCLRCGAVLARSVQAGRGTWSCPACQRG